MCLALLQKCNCKIGHQVSPPDYIVQNTSAVTYNMSRNGVHQTGTLLYLVRLTKCIRLRSDEPHQVLSYLRYY